MPFELTRPSGLWLLTLAIPLIVLYVLKVRRQPARFSSVWLWQSAQRDLLAERPFRRLLPQLPLLLQLLALLCLALALSGPALRGNTISGSHVAIVIDTSASMLATSDGQTRFEQAQRAAREVIARLGPGSDALLVAAGGEPRIASSFERDPVRLRGALSAIQVDHVAADLDRAVALAVDRLRAQHQPKRLVVITDGAGPAPTLPSTEVSSEVIRVGAPVDNSGISRVDIRRGRDASAGTDLVQVFAMVSHFGVKPRDVFVTLRQKDATGALSSRRLQLRPGERAPVVLSFEPAAHDDGIGLIVELSPPDALLVDDRAYVRVPGSPKLPVVVAPAQASPWIRRAIASDEHTELLGAEASQLTAQHVPPDALVVVQGMCPPKVPGSSVLIVDPPPGPCRTVEVGGVLNSPLLTGWAESEPRLRFINLDGVSIARARSLRTESAKQDLIRTREGTVVADASLLGQLTTVIGFDVGESNWPLKASFVLFMRNVMELAREERARGRLTAVNTGEAARVRVPLPVRDVKVEAPDGSRQNLSAHEGLVVLPEAKLSGFYFASWTGENGGSVLVPANLGQEAESDLTPRAWPPQSAAARAGLNRLATGVADWSWGLAALGLLFITADVLWYTRRAPARRAQQKAA